MSNVTSLPEAAADPGSPVLAPASGEPRPLTVRRIRRPDSDNPPAPVIRLNRRPQPRWGTVETTAQESSALSQVPVPATADGDDAEARRITGIARSIAQAALEVLGGSRPVQQMARWLDSRSYERLLLRSNMVREARQRRGAGQRSSLHRNAVVRSTRICRLSETVYETAMIVAERDRVRAVALRLELRRGLWKVTALEIG